MASYDASKNAFYAAPIFKDKNEESKTFLKIFF